jgi:hypothetical protein
LVLRKHYAAIREIENEINTALNLADIEDAETRRDYFIDIDVLRVKDWLTVDRMPFRRLR